MEDYPQTAQCAPFRKDGSRVEYGNVIFSQKGEKAVYLSPVAGRMGFNKVSVRWDDGLHGIYYASVFDLEMKEI